MVNKENIYYLLLLLLFGLFYFSMGRGYALFKQVKYFSVLSLKQAQENGSLKHK